LNYPNSLLPEPDDLLSMPVLRIQIHGLDSLAFNVCQIPEPVRYLKKKFKKEKHTNELGLFIRNTGTDQQP
jgi:hypothetical protein